MNTLLESVKASLPEKSFIRDLLEAATADDGKLVGRRSGSQRSPQDDSFGPDADPYLPRRGAGQYFDYESRQWAWVILSGKKTASIAKIASGWTHLAKVHKHHPLPKSDPKADSDDSSTKNANDKDAWKNICELVRKDLQDVDKDMIEDLIDGFPWRKMRIGGDDGDSGGASV